MYPPLTGLLLTLFSRWQHYLLVLLQGGMCSQTLTAMIRQASLVDVKVTNQLHVLLDIFSFVVTHCLNCLCLPFALFPFIGPTTTVLSKPCSLIQCPKNRSCPLASALYNPVLIGVGHFQYLFICHSICPQYFKHSACVNTTFLLHPACPSYFSLTVHVSQPSIKTDHT